MWTALFGRGFGPVVRQTAKWMEAESSRFSRKTDDLWVVSFLQNRGVICHKPSYVRSSQSILERISPHAQYQVSARHWSSSCHGGFNAIATWARWVRLV
jgi:hypothetical protein